MFYLTNRVKRDFLASCEAITDGSLRLRTPEGDVHDFGQGGLQGEMQINDWSVVTAAATRGDIGLGQAYAQGLWDSPSIRDVAEVGLRNLHHFKSYADAGLFHALKYRVADHMLRPAGRFGRPGHLDVGNEFFQLWLDEGMSYSSGLFEEGDDLATAQARKNARMLTAAPQGRMLEIGCGWGGFTEAASEAGHEVTALARSAGQKGYADARMDGRADVRRADHREASGSYDSIVSIETLETLGPRQWPSFFATLKDRLATSGKAMLQTIVVPDDMLSRYLRSADYARHAMVPGGALLSRAEITKQAAHAGLKVVDDYAFGLSYARTCALWDDRMHSKTTRLRQMGFDRRFLRSWRYHLGAASAAFAAGRTDVLQMQLVHADTQERM